MQRSRKTFHFIFPSRSWKRSLFVESEQKMRESPWCLRAFARGRATCLMNFYISMEKSKQKKKKLYSLWSIISIEETHLLYKTPAQKSAAHYRADFRQATSIQLFWLGIKKTSLSDKCNKYQKIWEFIWVKRKKKNRKK